MTALQVSVTTHVFRLFKNQRSSFLIELSFRVTGYPDDKLTFKQSKVQDSSTVVSDNNVHDFGDRLLPVCSDI